MATAPPPSQAQAEEAQRARYAAELAVLELFQSAGGGEGEGDSGGDTSSLHASAIRAILTAIALAVISSSFRIKPQDRSTAPEPLRSQDSVAETTLPAAQSLFQELLSSELTSEQQAVLWATWAYSQVADNIATAINEVGPEEFGGKTLRKVWISRSDARVRELHRKLHGKTIPSSSDFWRWPTTGQRLRWPGDSDAPLDATIGCRCVCLLTWADQKGVSSTIRTIVTNTSPETS